MQVVSEFWNPVENNQSISQCLHGVKDDSNYTLYESDCETEMAVVCFGCMQGKIVVFKNYSSQLIRRAYSKIPQEDFSHFNIIQSIHLPEKLLNQMKKIKTARMVPTADAPITATPSW